MPPPRKMRPLTKEVKSRAIKPEVTLQLWARSAGRCEFRGCNRALYKSPVTQREGNISQRAHIWSFSEDGPRGRGPYRRNTDGLNGLSNLMLMCHSCHKEIDNDHNGALFPASRLREWKEAHETRVATVTGIDPKRSSHVVVYSAKIAHREIMIEDDLVKSALFPDWYPASEHPIRLSLGSQLGDRNEAFWNLESENLKKAFTQRIQPILNRTDGPFHYSLFGFAPIPLLILFGTLFSDKVRSEIYQRRRISQDWAWPKIVKRSKNSSLKVREPSGSRATPAIVLSLSDRVTTPLILDGKQRKFRIWEIYAPDPGTDLIQVRSQVEEFGRTIRKVLTTIGASCGKATSIHIFPATPLSCAIALGRLRMDKLDSTWVIYDYHRANGGFTQALTIGETHEQ